MASSNASAPERRRYALLRAFVLAAALAAPASIATAGTAAAPPHSARLAVAAVPPPGAATPAATGAAMPVAGTADPSANDLSALLRGMRSAPGVIAQFSETKELALLSSPLESTGTIYFVPPDRLVRVVNTPGRSRLVVSGDKVRFEDENGRKALDLSASPMARQMIDSFVVLFNGNEERLKELYETEYSFDGKTWRLRLVPRSAPLNRMISSFDLEGTDARIDRMEASEPDGDRTVTRFGETDAHHRFTPEEIAELFGEDPAS